MKHAMILAAMAVGLTSCGDRSATSEGPDAKPGASDDASVDFDTIASRIVTESAEVKPGEVVLITGTLAEPKLLEALAGAVALAGGHPIVSVGFPNAQKRFLTQASEEILRQPSRGDLALIEAADVFISADTVDDPALLEGVDENRLNIVREANLPVARASQAKRARSVGIGQSGGIPTEAYAKSRNADYGDMRAMFFRALAVPAATIAERGRAVAAKMQPGSTVRVQGGGGTDLTFQLAAKPPRISTGKASDNDTGMGQAQAYLPAGDFYACVDPASANGVLSAAAYPFRGKTVRNLRITFQNGLATALTADEGGEALQAYWAQLDEPSKRLSMVNIGLNPESRPLEGSDYLSWEMAGVPTVQIGNAQWAGCDNGGEGGMIAHVTDATVAAGEAPVVNAGALVTN